MIDYAILPGKFQPPHDGHLSLIREGLQHSAHVIVALGDVDLAPSIMRPWSVEERATILRSMLSRDERERVTIIGVADNPYCPLRWAATLTTRVNTVIAQDAVEPAQVAVALLAANDADADAAAELFPDWIRLAGANDGRSDSASLRAAILGSPGTQLPELPGYPENGLAALRATLRDPRFATLRAEFAANAAFRDRWANAPWPPVFVTVDAVVVAAGHVLLIQRGRFPGRGLWALPGGFLDANESLRDACLRELIEETSIDCEPRQLRDALQHIEVFDEPDRSARGRTITHAFRFDLNTPPPAVRGGDDAAAARWVALEKLRRAELFEDHYAILQSMLGVE